MLGEGSAPEAAEEETIPQEGSPEVEETEEISAEEAEEEVEEIVDPGQLEGTGENAIVKEHEPPSTSPRYKKIYYEAKEGARQVVTLTEENAALKKQLEERVAVQAPTVPPEVIAPAQAEVKPPEVPEQESILKGSLTELKRERTQALTEVDGARAAEIQDKIDSVSDELWEMRMARKGNVDSKAITEAIQKKEVDSAVAGFISKTPWFAEANMDGSKNTNYDPMMAGAAVTLEKSLAKTWKGTYQDMLIEVGKQVEERFNPQTTQPIKPKLSMVQSPTTIRPAVGSPPTALSKAEQKAARVIFPDSKNPETEYINLRKSQGAN